MTPPRLPPADYPPPEFRPHQDSWSLTEDELRARQAKPAACGMLGCLTWIIRRNREMVDFNREHSRQLRRQGQAEAAGMAISIAWAQERHAWHLLRRLDELERSLGWTREELA